MHYKSIIVLLLLIKFWVNYVATRFMFYYIEPLLWALISSLGEGKRFPNVLYESYFKYIYTRKTSTLYLGGGRHTLLGSSIQRWAAELTSQLLLTARCFKPAVKELPWEMLGCLFAGDFAFSGRWPCFLSGSSLKQLPKVAEKRDNLQKGFFLLMISGISFSIGSPCLFIWKKLLDNQVGVEY